MKVPGSGFDSAGISFTTCSEYLFTGIGGNGLSCCCSSKVNSRGLRLAGIELLRVGPRSFVGGLCLLIIPGGGGARTGGGGGGVELSNDVSYHSFSFSFKPGLHRSVSGSEIGVEGMFCQVSTLPND